MQSQIPVIVDSMEVEGNELELRVRGRLPNKADELLAILREHSITILEIRHGITCQDLIEETGICEREAQAIILDDSSWNSLSYEAADSWLDTILEKLPPHFDENIKAKVKSAILTAGIKSDEELRNMTPEDLAKAKVPLAARGWISDYGKRSTTAAPVEVRVQQHTENITTSTTNKLVLNTRPKHNGENMRFMFYSFNSFLDLHITRHEF